MNRPGLTVVNFAHPLTAAHVGAIEAMAKQYAERIINAPAQFGDGLPFVEQARVLVEAVGRSPVEWQTLPLLVNLPSLPTIAALVLAELHGRCGYFPAVLRLRRVEGTSPPEWEVAEILDLQAVRDAARRER